MRIIEIELAPGSESEVIPNAILQSITTNLGLRPQVFVVPRNTLPRFDLKAQRFKVITN